MAKELPYFRFTVQEWQNGDISLENYELKGLFIDICSYYWIKNCNLDIDTLKKRFRDSNGLIDELISLNIIKKNKNNIFISFLDEQMNELTKLSENRKKAGSKGGKVYSRWTEIERTKGEQFYIILFYNNDEMFIKIGSTSTCIADRYSVPNSYNQITIFQYLTNKSVDLEIYFHGILKGFIYNPKNKFGGYTECYLIESIDTINELCKNKGIEPLIDVKQTISKLQSNFNQTKSYKDKDKIRKDKNKDKDNFSFKNSLLEICSNEQLINDWLLVRKNKNATNSKTAFDSFIKQLQISDITIDEILTTCVEKSWSGYKFEWILNERKKVAQKKEIADTILNNQVTNRPT